MALGLSWPPLASSTWNPAERMALAKPALTVEGIIPAIMMGGLPSKWEHGVLMWMVPSLLEAIGTIPNNIVRVFIPCAHKLRSPFLAPPLFIPYILRVINLSTALALVTYNDDVAAMAVEVTRCERINTASASRTKVNGVSGCLGEIRCSSPLNRRREDMVAKRTCD